MAKELKQPNEFVIRLMDTLKSNPGQRYTFASLCEAAGVERKIGFISSMKAHLGENLKSDKAMVEDSKTVSAYTYNAPETPFVRTAKEEPSANSLAVANWFRDNEGNDITLADLSDALGFKVLSGHISGARAILGKENIVRSEIEVPVMVEKTVYWYED